MNLNAINMKDVVAEYQRSNMNYYRDHEAEEKALYEAYPEIKEIGGDLAELSIERAISRMSGREDADSYESKKESLIKRRKDLLRQAGKAEDFLERRYSCPECEDTGYVDGNMCRCLKEFVVKAFYRESGLSEVLRKENFGNFSLDIFSKETKNYEMSQYENMKNNLDTAVSYCDDFAEKGGNLLFIGKAGQGKTYLSNCIAERLLREGHFVLYETINGILSIYSSYINNKADKDIRELNDRFFDAELLIIDDLGTESLNSLMLSHIFELINNRIVYNRPTIISTNLGLGELREKYSERVASRIMGNYKVCHFYGDNIRYNNLNA